MCLNGKSACPLVHISSKAVMYDVGHTKPGGAIPHRIPHGYGHYIHYIPHSVSRNCVPCVFNMARAVVYTSAYHGKYITLRASLPLQVYASTHVTLPRQLFVPLCAWVGHNQIGRISCRGQQPNCGEWHLERGLPWNLAAKAVRVVAVQQFNWENMARLRLTQTYYSA
jgi:hypothetical protein